ncbi:MAG: tRNA-dihydrouridine synthase family protein [Desulfobulbaceae bacterium]|jgi:tRNA-dihydrouridine synthase|nr:tRNA-dihydrouridine synthase family protein [Desulfobulbaceae bacterium]
MTIRLIVAPLRGITDQPFRRAIARHFPGFSEAVAPFINPQKEGGATKKLAPLADLLPEGNQDLSVTPQLLDNHRQSFVDMARRLEDLGYQRINWNLGCPAPMVTRKGRGAAMLEKPEAISALLDFALPRLRCRLSLKMRLGMRDRGEILAVMPRLHDYPLTELIIHPRLGRQMFRGAPDLDGFTEALAASRQPVVYNGDILNSDDFRRLHQRFPQVAGWMIGRGAVARPVIAMEIVAGAPPDLKPRLVAFHDELFAAYQEKLCGPGHLLGKMKQLWLYFIASFPGQEKSLKAIVRAKDLTRYHEATRAVFDNPDNK